MILQHFLWLAVFLAFGLSPLAAQESGNNPAEGEYPVSVGPYQISPYDVLLQRIQIRFLDTYVDPDEYIVGPGDRFSLRFTAGDITDINSEINSDGTLFIKSVGSIKLAHVSLREAMATITERVAGIYSRTDFAVQLTGYRVVRINVIGEVKRPGIYYAPAIWRVSEVLDLAGGVTSQAALRHIILRGLGSECSADLVRFGTLSEPANNPMVSKGNIIDVPSRRSGSEMVSVSGRLNRPGMFEYVAGDRLQDYIDYAGGTDGDAADMEIVISSGGGIETERFDGAEKSAYNHEPRPGDNVKLVWKAGRKSHGTVDIFGAVVRPGRYPLEREDFSLEELLRLCGGVADDGSPEMIQVFRRDWRRAAGEGSVSSVGSTVSEGVISRNPRDPWKASDFILIDGDSLYIPRATGMVAVSGAVGSPGLVRYREGKGVDYYLDQAGGLGFDADKNRMVVISPTTGGRIEADGAGELFDGEILFVPQKESQTKP